MDIHSKNLTLGLERMSLSTPPHNLHKQLEAMGLTVVEYHAVHLWLH